MKKIGKLSINPEKVIKNEELVNLKGGYGGGYCRCIIEWGDWTQEIKNGCAMQDCDECESILWETYSGAVSIACE